MSAQVGTMKKAGTRLSLGLACIWLCVMSTMTVWKFGPTALNADILINTVMSLQKLTLYYWGQNRLLNVLPWATTWLRDPAANLFAVQWLTALSCFSLLYLFSHFAAKVLKATDVNATALQALMVMSSAFVLMFTPRAIGEIAIGHIEYALAALLGGLSLYLVVNRRSARWWSWVLPALTLTVAMGMNPSTVIPAVFAVMVLTLYRRRPAPAELAWGGLAILAFVSWTLISRQFGDASYGHFDPSLLPTGARRVGLGLLETLRGTASLVFAGCVFGVWLLARSGASPSAPECGRAARYIVAGALVFSAGWFVLFASSGWVAINQFSWRYFTYVIFALLLLGTLFVTHALCLLKPALGKLAAVVAALVAAVATWTTPLPVEQYKVFQRVNAQTRPGGHLYAGDYWVVWPSVLRDMLHQQEAYGLAFRGEANRDAALAYMTQHIQQHGHVDVYCLNETADTCQQQIARSVGQFKVADVQRLSDSVQVLRLNRYQPGLRIVDEDLLRLPSAVGTTSEGARTTDGRRGFLLYGPYRFLHAGRYQLVVNGTSRFTEGAYVDLASRTGRQIHAKFDLRPNANGELVRDAVVHLDRDVNELEVRVWVNADNAVSVTGYALQRLPDEPAP